MCVHVCMLVSVHVCVVWVSVHVVLYVCVRKGSQKANIWK